VKQTRHKVIYIALDAASKDLIFTWCKQGLLPHISKLKETGTWGLTQNAPGVYAGSLWPSVWSGTTPGQHGSYYNEQIKPGSYETVSFLGEDVRKKPFWDALSQAGHRVCLFDVPKTPLSKGLNGIHIVDWGTHDSEIPACSWPAHLIKEIKQKYGVSAFRRCDWVMDGQNPEQTLQGHLLKRIETRLAIAEDLLQREPWDLFMMAFGESHCIGHQCWHLHDPSHPNHMPELRELIGDPIRNIYMAIDAAVGRLLEYAGADTTVLLHCSHGMSAHYDASYLLDEALRRLEGRPAPTTRSLLDKVRKQWKKLPVQFTERFGTLARAVNRMPDANDRAARSCFVVPTNANSAGIRLNLEGREPDGKISPGKEADEYVKRLVDDLREITDPGDGRQLVKEVIRSSETFPGQHSDLLPDLFIRWNRDKPITGMSSAKIGTIIGEDHSTRRTGDHRPGGLFFLRGPGVSPGEHLPIVNDEDIAPTLAACMGVRLNGISGQPIQSKMD